jgi:hypothetical protein
VATRPALALLAALGCAGPAADADHYLRYTAWETAGHDWVLLRWQTREMPLAVHLPPPPAGMVRDPEAVLDAVRDGFSDWTDAAGPGLPSFRFVDGPGAADIPVVWETEPSGDWYIAHCVLDIHERQQRFGVTRILVLARQDGRENSLDALYQTMLHEVGHALGLRHSPRQGDIMYRSIGGADGLSARDRETLRRLYALPIGQRVSGARTSD